jgi:hypothetical protein
MPNLLNSIQVSIIKLLCFVPLNCYNGCFQREFHNLKKVSLIYFVTKNAIVFWLRIKWTTSVGRRPTGASASASPCPRRREPLSAPTQAPVTDLWHMYVCTPLSASPCRRAPVGADAPLLAPTQAPVTDLWHMYVCTPLLASPCRRAPVGEPLLASPCRRRRTPVGADASPCH